MVVTTIPTPLLGRSKLTRKQIRYYSRWMGGASQKEIAVLFDTTQPRVSEVICRARRRNPKLPLPPICGGRHRRVTPPAAAA